MRFDPASFAIGFVSAALIAFIIYRFRTSIIRARQGVSAQVGSTGRAIGAGALSRYVDEVIKLANRSHIAGEKAELTDLYVEPRFLSADPPIDLEATADPLTDVFRVVPRLYDLPAVFSPYNINTLSINDLRAGDRHMILLGPPGAGKSTALAVLALYAVGHIELQSLDTLAEQVLEDEDKSLSEAEREARTKLRKEQQERALAQLHDSQARETERRQRLNLPAYEPIEFQKLLPILVHLRDIDLSQPIDTGKANSKAASDKRQPLDPAEPLVRAAMRHIGSVTANIAPRLLYNRLTAGKCLILLDGFDELSQAQWPEKLTWLTQFLADYGHNAVIAAGPIEGYDSLVNAGLTPVFMRPWADSDFERLINRWATAWPTIGGTRRRPVDAPDSKLVKRVITNNRGRNALDVTLKTWAAFAGGEQESGRRSGYDFYVRSALSDVDKQRPTLAQIAAAALDNGGGPLRRDQILATVSGSEVKPAGVVTETVDKLLSSGGLLSDAPGGYYTFRHPLLAGFLAADTLLDAPPERIEAIADQPAWELALPFAAARVSLDSAVKRRLSTAPDLLYTTLFDLARWLPDAPPNVPWKNEVLKRFTAALMAPTQYPAVRDRAVAALVTTRDPGVLFVLRQALRSTDAMVRRLACIGLGALGDAEAIKDLEPMMTDPDVDVQLAAGLALGAIGSEAALERLVSGLLDGDESLRRAIAEMLAAIPDGGHEILRELSKSDDVMVRRAVVFGLSRVHAPWALALLYRALLEDAQWYVRSAAEQAFHAAERSEGSGPVAHPNPDGLPWMIEWAAGKGDSVPVGEAGRQLLIRVLQEADPLRRAAAALTIAYLGYVPGLKPLYAALRDKDENVRGTAYEALAALQLRLGEPLPAV